MDLKKVFRAIGSKMLTDFDNFESEIMHMGELRILVKSSSDSY
jgi:hypothetical protein